MESKLKLELRLEMREEVRELGVINGFCYPYARLLLDKAIALAEDDTLLTEINEDDKRRYLTPAGEVIFSALGEQIPGIDISRRNINEGHVKILKIAEEFLAIFEE